MFGAGAKPSKRTKNVLGTRVFERLGYFPNIALDLVFLANCLMFKLECMIRYKIVHQIQNKYLAILQFQDKFKKVFMPN